MTESILLASQGIYNRKRELFGTELLFRNESGSTAMEVGENVATSEVIVNHVTSITDEISHLQRPAFINVCADFLLSEAFLPIDPQYLYIELVERIDVTEEIVTAVKSWKRKGFRFALDDFEFTKEWNPLLELADVVKIDVLGMDMGLVRRRKLSLAAFGCKCLAERVETLEEFESFKEMGFDLFQGYFLARPKIIKGTNIRPEQASASAIINATSSDSNFDEVAETVARDPRLSVQVLKMVNSPLYNLESPVDTIREAIVFLGMESLRKWAIVLSLLSASDNCKEAHRIVLTRAKFCEFYAKELRGVDPEKAFLMGLLSGMDILLGVLPEEFAKTIHLGEEMNLAIIEKEGRLGKVLKLAVNLENLINSQPEKLVHSKQSVLDIYHESFFWTEEVIKSFS